MQLLCCARGTEYCATYTAAKLEAVAEKESERSERDGMIFLYFFATGNNQAMAHVSSR